MESITRDPTIRSVNALDGKHQTEMQRTAIR